jgi:hypothetical protein
VTAYVLYIDRTLRQSIPEEEKRKPVSEEGNAHLKKPQKHVPPERKTTDSARQKVAIIIDDLGSDLKAVRELLAIDAPIAFSILPYGSHSAEAAEIAHRAGREVVLHLPMEPHNFPEENPGEGALFLQMDDGELVKQIEMDLEAIPHIRGVNNHMGSRFMENEAKLSVVMQRIKEKRLFFVDSMTTANSKGREVAEKKGVPFAARKIFIDNGHDFDDTYNKLINIMGIKNNGKTELMLLIGHSYPGTIRALKKSIPLFKEKNIEIIPVSDLVKGS